MADVRRDKHAQIRRHSLARVSPGGNARFERHAVRLSSSRIRRNDCSGWLVEPAEHSELLRRFRALLRVGRKACQPQAVATSTRFGSGCLFACDRKLAFVERMASSGA
jgi:hypothetical protein